MATIGVIGLGNIGGAIAANLVADGHTVTVFDTDPTRAARARIDAGAAPRPARPPSPRRARSPSPRCRRPPSSTRSPTHGSEASAPDAVLVDLSTNAPASRARARGAARGRRPSPVRGAAHRRRARGAGAHARLHGGRRARGVRARAPVLEKLGRGDVARRRARARQHRQAGEQPDGVHRHMGLARRCWRWRPKRASTCAR